MSSHEKNPVLAIPCLLSEFTKILIEINEKEWKVEVEDESSGESEVESEEYRNHKVEYDLSTLYNHCVTVLGVKFALGDGML